MSRYDVQEWQWRLSLRARADALQAVRGICAALLLCAPFWTLAFFVWRWTR